MKRNLNHKHRHLTTPLFLSSSLSLLLFFFTSVLVRSVSRRFGNTLLQHKSADDLHVYFLSTFFPLFFLQKSTYHWLSFFRKWGKKGSKRKYWRKRKREKKGKRGKKEAEWNDSKYTFCFFFCFLMIKFLSFSGFCKLFSAFRTLKGSSSGNQLKQIRSLGSAILELNIFKYPYFRKVVFR